MRIAARADVIVAALGECAEMSGESVSRTNLEIPDAQQDLLKALVKTGKPVVLLLFTGRPLVLNWEDANVHSILNVWFGGSETGDAVADVLFGKNHSKWQTDNYLPAFGGTAAVILQSFEYRSSFRGRKVVQ